MGGGKDQKQANSQLQSQTAYQTGQQQAFDTRNTADLNSSKAKGDQLYGELHAGYGSLAGGAPGTTATGGGGGGYNTAYQMAAVDPRYNDVEAKYKDFMSTGGWDPNTKEGQQGRINTLTEMGKTGGISPEDQARMRGGGLYEEFAKTGGLSDKDRANIRSRGTSGIPAMYEQMKQQQQRQAAVSGGYGPGANVMAGRMARQQQGGMADAALNSELGIQQQVNQGRQFGATGMERSEGSLQDLLTRNKMGATTSAADIQGKMQESIMGGQQWGTQGQKGIADMYQGRADQQNAINAAGAANAAAGSSANDKWAQEFNARQKALGLEGLGSLYSGQGSGEYNLNKDFALQSAGVYGNQVGQGSIAQKTGNVNPWDNVANIAGAVAGGMSGLGAVGSGIKATGGLGQNTQFKSLP